MNNTVSKIAGAMILTVLWILGFLYISPTLVIDFGGGATINLKLVVVVLMLLIIFFYHLLYPSSATVTKLSWTTVFTMVWLSLIIFFPFRTSSGGGAMGFWVLISGLAVSVLWVHFFADEISLS